MPKIKPIDSCLHPLLKKVPIFKHLNDQAIAKLAAISEVVSHDLDDVIFEKDATADALYIVLSGQVRIEQKYRDGRRKTLAYMAREHFFGEMAIVTHHKRCASAIVCESTELLRIGKEPFLSLLRKDVELCYGILQEICERLRSADEEIGNLTFRNLPGRIASKLFDLADQFGEVVDGGGTVLKLTITHYDLADMVGTNRESISKYLSKFRKEGAIETRGRLIVIKNRQKLLAWR